MLTPDEYEAIIMEKGFNVENIFPNIEDKYNDENDNIPSKPLFKYIGIKI
jgi:hypothetical protein